MDREAMIAELESGQAETTATQSTPQVAETPVTQNVSSDVFEYYLGDKANKLPSSAEFAIKHAGQIQRIPASKLINNYRQSAHLEQKLKELTGRYGEYEKQVGPLDAWAKRKSELEKFEELQKWSEANPEKFQYVWDALNKDKNGLLQTDAQNPQSDALQATLQELRRELGDLKSWKQTREEQDREAKVQEEMGIIDQEIAQFAKDYGEKYGIDLDEVNEEGITLRGQILKFAADKGINEFETAALRYLKDALFEKAGQRAREEALKGAKGDVAAGVISRSSIPHSGQGAKVDVKKMTAEERRNAALQELTASNA